MPGGLSLNRGASLGKPGTQSDPWAIPVVLHATDYDVVCAAIKGDASEDHLRRVVMYLVSLLGS